MAAVALKLGGAPVPDWAFRWSLAGHGLLLLLVMLGGLTIPRSPPTSQLAIKATVVSPNATRQPRTPPSAAKNSVAAKPEPKPEPKVDPKIEERRAEQQKQERQQAAQHEKAVQEKQHAEQLKAQQTAEKQKLEKQQQEKQAQEKAAAEKLQEEKLKAEKLKAEKLKAAQAKELAAQLEAEEHLLAATQSGALADYLGMISQRVTRNWIRPPSARAGLEAVVLVTQILGGEVISAQIVSCNGDEAVCRSIQAAVLRASPLPLPDDPLLFDRSLRFTFKPEQ